MVDHDIIMSKIDSIKRHVDRLKSIRKMKIHVFLDSDDTKDIAILNLQMAIQKCIDIGNHFYSEWDIGAPSSYGDVFEEMCRRKVLTRAMMKKMMLMVGLRNRIVHEYEELDYNKIHSFLKNDLNDFNTFLKQVLKYSCG